MGPIRLGMKSGSLLDEWSNVLFHELPDESTTKDVFFSQQLIK